MFDISVAGSMATTSGSRQQRVYQRYGGVANAVHIGDGWEVSGAIVATLSDSALKWVSASPVVATTTFLRWKTDTTRQLPLWHLLVAGVSAQDGRAGQLLMSTTRYSLPSLLRPHDYQDVTDTRAAFVTWWNF